MCHFVSNIMYFQKIIGCKTLLGGGRGSIGSSRSNPYSTQAANTAGLYHLFIPLVIPVPT